MNWKNTLLLTSFLVLIGSTAFAEEHLQVDHDNIVILIDTSGSMDYDFGSVTRMTAAKNALKVVLAQLDKNTHVGILKFPQSAFGNINWTYPLGPIDQVKLFKSIDTLSPGGDTPLGKYMKHATDALTAKRKEQLNYGTYRLLIVTDGAAGDSNVVKRWTPQILSRGIRLDVIGVGMGDDHVLAKRAHTYRTADNPKALKRSIESAIAEVSASDFATPEQEAEFFALLAPLKTEQATQFIAALADMPNHPLGERPAVSIDAKKPPTQVGGQQPHNPRQQHNQQDDGGGFFLIFSFILLFIICIGFFLKFLD